MGSSSIVSPEQPATVSDGRSAAAPPRSARPLRVCVVAPSLDILGGQAVVAQRLMDRLRDDPELEISFVPHNPRLPGPFRLLQRVKYVRTIATSASTPG